MSKQAVFTMKLESELRENFMAEAGRASMHAGLGRLNNDVEVTFAAKRNAVSQA